MNAWTAHTVTTNELIDPFPVAALASLFDDGLPTPAPGDSLPPLWHWAALPQWSPSSELSSDGHPFRGSFLPPVELPRRMFAGGNVAFLADLRVGDTTRRVSTVESVTEKNGRSGRFVIVVVSTTLFTPAGERAVVERQNLIYREAPTDSEPNFPAGPDAPATVVPAGPPLVADSGGEWDFRTDPTLLMRFSAATANAHRIHYDWPYATGVEGYPGLVVHGPLMTLALAETHRLNGTPDRIETLVHRNRAPLFCGQSAHLRSTATVAGHNVELIGPDAGIRTAIELTLSKGAQP
ncbi:FAS1-like dehydratase domain-containing protein [Gordonia sp. CPCC 205333]|uniref:FAS1-like dehydratase domain-containing protein n=1 Tax=Gordonia sp. CPCC 205333 TaxID=3140790 RepID=UPI003AF3DEFC